MNRWNEAITKVQKTQDRPQLIFEETGRAVAMLRDLFNPTYENIYVNDDEICTAVRHYVSLIAPEKANIVKNTMARYQSLTTLMLPNRSNLVLGRPLIMDMVVISSSSIQKPCTL